RVVRPLALAPIDEDGMPGDWSETLTVNVSGNGLLASGPDWLDVGDAIAFRLMADEDEEPIGGRGRVARIGEDGQRGIAIEQIDREARRQLVRFVFEQERIARQRTRDGEL
ncbi:MAG TPA: PilZ domain-containing protein, partial [Conexibacter sp.]|nr:PilZ domain-containing protein [Conexibacter sp.]